MRQVFLHHVEAAIAAATTAEGARREHDELRVLDVVEDLALADEPAADRGEDFEKVPPIKSI